MSLIARYKLDESSGLVAVDEVAAANAAADPDNVAVSISDCVDDGATLISVVTSTHHNFSTGDTVDITGVSGTTEANGTWTITKTSNTTFTLDGSTFANAYTGGGTADRTSAFPWSWSGTAASVPSGSTGSLSIAANSHFDTPNILVATKASAFSVACWVQRASTAGSRSAAVGARVVSGSFEFCLGTGYTTPTKFSCDVGKAYTIHQPCEATATYSLNTWYHLCAVTRNNGGNWEVELYVNGVSQSVTQYAGDVLTASDSDGTWSIGSEPDDTAQNDYSFGWDGLIDEVRFYDHGLSVAEVEALAGLTTTPLASLSASTTSIAENGGIATIYALLSETASASVTVGMSVSGVATTASDYSLSTTSITIASGQTSGSISATAISDSVYEGSEAFTIAIASITGGGVSASSNSATSVTIIDDDFGTVYLTSSDVSIAEANASAALVAVISATESATVNVILSLSGTATSGSDYSLGSATVSIASGSTTGSVSVTTIQDTLDENTETIVVSIGSISGAGSYTHASQPWTFTIADDDPTPTVTVAASTASITENAGSAAFIATLSAASGRTASATVNVGFGTATENVDFTTSTASFFWPAGTTTASIGVTSLADILFESNETIVLSLATFQNCAIGSPFSASITIVNEYLAPFVNLTASTTSISENSGSATVYVRLDHTHSADVTVVVAFTGSATLNTDYSRSTDSVVIASGASSGSISITALQDSVGEANETVIVSIANVTNGTAASSASATTVTIVDDDSRAAGNSGIHALSGLSAIC